MILKQGIVFLSVFLKVNTARYSCKNICGTTAPEPTDDYGTTCSCEPGCGSLTYVNGTMCCPDYKVICENHPSWKISEVATSCPHNWTPPLLLVSMDGYRAQYLTDNADASSVLLEIQNRGVKIPAMRASFPSKTFPNHYSIVTGLYPEAHGIVSNRWSDVSENKTFNAFDATGENPEDWFGEPIWNNVQRHGKKAAAYFWPGSEVNITGNQPNLWKVYDEEDPFEHRVFEVLKWIDLPDDERPDFINLYLHQPDKSGHLTGTDSEETDKDIRRVNSMIDLLLEGLSSRNLFNCVNIMIVSDHGMVNYENININNHTDVCSDTSAKCWPGPVMRIGQKVASDQTFDLVKAQKDLKCLRHDKNLPVNVYSKMDMPYRLHFTDSSRIEDLLILGDLGYEVNDDDSFRKGNHGWDNSYLEMHAIGIFHGPAFKKRYHFDFIPQNVELYGMMCEILGIEPTSNNGTTGSLFDILVRDTKIKWLENAQNIDNMLPTRIDGSEVTVEQYQHFNQILFDGVLAMTNYKIPKGAEQLMDSKICEKDCKISYASEFWLNDTQIDNNRVEVHPNLHFFWNILTSELFNYWSRTGDLTIFAGPITKNTLETHIFMIVYRELAGEVTAASYIFPLYVDEFTCNIDLTDDPRINLIQFMKTHMATIRDIENASGFLFDFNDTSTARMKQRLYLPLLTDKIWDEDQFLMRESKSTSSSSILGFSLIFLLGPVL